MLIAGGCAVITYDFGGALTFTVNSLSSWIGWDYGSASSK
nr:MAG TPA: hypothetical protein [Caudoviricetes sp.]